MLEYECPHCHEILSIPEQFIGTTGTCRKCHKSITIEAPSADTGGAKSASFVDRAPTLVVFHCESTGSSTRKCNITELAGIKIELDGNELDSFWSFANPGHEIPSKISNRTGVTDDMVGDAPFSNEVVKRWFEWIGPNALLFSYHAHFTAKFVCGTLLKQDIAPPLAHIIDVMEWAQLIEVPAVEYKFRPLLEHIDFPIKDTHRALDACHGLAALVGFLTKSHVGAHLQADQSGMLGRMLGKKTEAINSGEAYKQFEYMAKTLEETCDPGYFGRMRGGDQAEAGADSGNGHPGAHKSAWYAKTRRQLEKYMETTPQNPDALIERVPEDAQWEYAVLEASQSHDADEQRQLWHQAVSLGARDPWPYERLAGIYIKEKDYQAALGICDQYFQTENWKVPEWAESSLKLLRRLEKLEHKLAK